MEIPEHSGRRRHNWDIDSDLKIWVPVNASVGVETVSASIDVRDVGERTIGYRATGPSLPSSTGALNGALEAVLPSHHACGSGDPGRYHGSIMVLRIQKLRKVSEEKAKSMPRTVPSGSVWRRPWSFHSHRKPPCRPGVDVMTSQ